MVLELGEYTYTLTPEGKQLITRNGEPWRDETGDNFILAMAQRLSDTQVELSLSEQAFDQVNATTLTHEDIVSVLRSLWYED